MVSKGQYGWAGKSHFAYYSAFKNIVGYGGSMGGYAAIKYSNLLNMNRIIAFVPQYSIDPEQVEDRRYAEFFNAVVNKDMQIQPQDVDVSREYIIVYDPYFSIDREHYLKIKEILPSLHTIHLPFYRTWSFICIGKLKPLHDFIEHEFDETYFYQQVRKIKNKASSIIVMFLQMCWHTMTACYWKYCVKMNFS